MAEKTIKVRGSGGGVFDVIVTPRILKKLKTGVLVRVEEPKARRGQGTKPSEPKAPEAKPDGASECSEANSDDAGAKVPEPKPEEAKADAKPEG